MFKVYFTSEHTLNVDLNHTNVLSLKDAYDGPSQVGAWTYVGISLVHLFDTTQNDDVASYETKICVYIYGGKTSHTFERKGCNVTLGNYYDETTSTTISTLKQWDTKLG